MHELGVVFHIIDSLEEVAKEKKLGAVIYKNGMAWGGIDVTDEVLKKLQ